MKGEERKVRDYIGGASLIFGIAVLTSQFLGLYYGSMKLNHFKQHDIAMVYTAFISSHLIGGVLGGFLVSRRRDEGLIKAGLITALIAYVIEYIYHLIFERVFPGHLEALIATLIGGFIGGLLALTLRRMSAPSPPDSPLQS